MYSLGATILFLLTHRSPADLPQKRIKIDFRDRISVSEEFADWLEKILEPAVEDRFNSAAQAFFWIVWKLFKFQNRQCGQTTNLHRVEIITEKKSESKAKNYCALWHGTKKYTFSVDLTSVEQSWLTKEILDFLSHTVDLMY